MNPRDEVPLVKHTCHQSPLAHNDLPHPVNLRRETHTVNSHQNPVAPSLLCAIISVGLAPRKKSRQSFLCGEDRQRGQAWRPGRTGEGTFSSGAVTEPARPWDRSPHDPPTHPQIQRPQKRPMESKPKRPPTTSSPPKLGRLPLRHPDTRLREPGLGTGGGQLHRFCKGHLTCEEHLIRPKSRPAKIWTWPVTTSILISGCGLRQV